MTMKEAMTEIFKHIHFTKKLLRCPECNSDSWHLSENGKLQCANCSYYTRINVKVAFRNEMIYQKVA